MSQRLRVTIVVTALLLSLGCRNTQRSGGQAATVARAPVAAQLQPAEPAPLTPVVERSATAAPSPTGYRRLTARVCQELAVRNSVIGNVLEEAALEPDEGKKKHRASGAGEARTLALLYAAEEARNRAAGEALDLYYKLAAAEAGAQVGRGAEGDLNRLLKTARAAVAAGQKEPPGTGQLEAQLAEVSADVIRAEGGAREANHGLRALLGLPQDSTEQLWPDAPEVGRAPENVDEAVRVGLAYRPDLLLLRTLLGSGDPGAPETEREALGTASPLLAGPPSLIPGSAGIVLRAAAACMGLDLPSPGKEQHVRQMLAELQAGRERQAEAEIRAAFEHAVALAAQAKAHADHADKARVRMEDLEKAEAAGRGDAQALAVARAAYRKATGNVVTAATSYQAAVAKLRQAQGVLAREILDPAFKGPR
jgi:outer membrane protein TolC